ncbi:Hypothetical Protein FCC1311_001742 [Hondaea fermentalgiana]|uniref:Uncharacterized protein n=1 Tax=Hondaea fermentalgiana TaxID=2315210 RepID=A0A2R5G0A6_9STRA|nr:Hypothetical Protein FCC1311_001742 [Hondaea fermentalgiana]|eukprot:GBG23955.1 Hypothetical Protein FCC1311_001742 [Hondaea fermentalgiana]
MMEDHDESVVAEAVPPPAAVSDARADEATGERLLLPEEELGANSAQKSASAGLAGSSSSSSSSNSGAEAQSAKPSSATGPALRVSKAGALTGTAVDDVADGMSRSQLDDYYSSNAGATSFDEEDDESFQQRTGLDGAIPVDKLKNGAATAFSFLQWGVSKVSEQAKEVHGRLNENENYRQASERMGSLYEERVRPGVEVVREGASSMYEKARPTVDNLAERAKPVLEEGWTVTKEKVGQLGEACRPGMDRAAESTREAFERVKASANGGVAKSDDAASKKKDDDDGESPFTQI